MSKPSPQEDRQPIDGFQILSMMGIALGMMIVVAGFVVWFTTGRQSSLIIGAGLALASGGGLREVAAKYLSQAPQYNPPPSHLPKPKPVQREEETD